MKLFMFYLGDDCGGSNIELHDIRFSIGEMVEDCYPDLRKQWWGETLAFYGRLKRIPRGDIAVLLERVGLTEAADRRIGSYSKGMRQRLGLAQALLGEPAVLLLDEPTTGLNPALQRSFYDAVDEIRSRGATIVLSSHALTELEGRADRVIIVNRGVKIADGSIEDLRTIARLPTRIRVRLADRPAGVVENWIGSTGPWRRIGDFNHLIDPRTGRSPKRYGNVTVVTPQAVMADGLSTAFCLMDEAAIAAALRQLEQADAYVLPASGGKLLRFASDG